jgi:formylglycine-generating enzyme required for sulfatase activity
MFRQSAAVVFAALTALGSLGSATAQEVEKAGDKKQITNSIGMKLVLLPAGEFIMGSRQSREELVKMFAKYESNPVWSGHEYPAHRVRITKPFFLGAHHVTVGQFRQFVTDAGYTSDAEKPGKKGSLGWDAAAGRHVFQAKCSWRNPGFEQTDEHPAVCLSWNDAVAFCEWLSRKEGKDYRLPSEAEWEYACRAGTTMQYWCGDDPEGLAQAANVADATAKAKLSSLKSTIIASDGYVFTSPVGRFRANPFGLYDMHGNAMQWCADWYDARYYGASPANDPNGPDSGTRRVLRGSSWISWPSSNRSAFRGGFAPDTRSDFTGFRVARTSYPLEERAGLSGKPTTRMRPLGRHLMVDEHGIIWDGGRPVGIWGVNGSPMTGRMGGFRGADGNRQPPTPPAR